MFRKLFALIVIAALCCAATLAQAQNGSKRADWLTAVQKKIETIVPKKIQPFGNGFESVRGSKEDASLKLYWKGKKNDELVTEEELSAFKKGIVFAVKGERAEAVNELQAFMKRYPDSALIPDAKKTLDLVKAEEK